MPLKITKWLCYGVFWLPRLNVIVVKCDFPNICIRTSRHINSRLMWLRSDWQPHLNKTYHICVWMLIKGVLTDFSKNFTSAVSQNNNHVCLFMRLDNRENFFLNYSAECHIPLPTLRVWLAALSRTSHRATAWLSSEGHSFWWIFFFQFLISQKRN